MYSYGQFRRIFRGIDQERGSSLLKKHQVEVRVNIASASTCIVAHSRKTAASISTVHFPWQIARYFNLECIAEKMAYQTQSRGIWFAFLPGAHNYASNDNAETKRPKGQLFPTTFAIPRKWLHRYRQVHSCRRCLLRSATFMARDSIFLVLSRGSTLYDRWHRLVPEYASVEHGQVRSRQTLASPCQRTKQLKNHSTYHTFTTSKLSSAHQSLSYVGCLTPQHLPCAMIHHRISSLTTFDHTLFYTTVSSGVPYLEGSCNRAPAAGVSSPGYFLRPIPRTP